MNNRHYKYYMILIIIGIFAVGGCVQGGMNQGMMQGQDMMQGQGGMMAGQGTTKTDFSSNGERIYYTATSKSGDQITFNMAGSGMGGGMNMSGGMMGTGAPMMRCVTCHGEDGRGGTVQMMMGSIEVPDIRYKTLTTEDNAHGEEGDEHIPYTEEDIKKAITEGIEPDGGTLKMPMPRWNMSEEDLDDLIEYLKTLDSDSTSSIQNE